MLDLKGSALHSDQMNVKLHALSWSDDPGNGINALDLAWIDPFCSTSQCFNFSYFGRSTVSFKRHSQTAYVALT
jgi:hypothetical protein